MFNGIIDVKIRSKIKNQPKSKSIFCRNINQNQNQNHKNLRIKIKIKIKNQLIWFDLILIKSKDLIYVDLCWFALVICQNQKSRQILACNINIFIINITVINWIHMNIIIIFHSINYILYFYQFNLNYYYFFSLNLAL